MMPIKIECGCGQRYAFDVEPVCGRMPGRVICPVCGVDGTRAANDMIAFTLATELTQQRTGPNIVMIFAVIGCLMAGLAGVLKALSMQDGLNVLLCLLASTGAFGLALAVYFWKRE